jgi:hypothetical protein
MAAAQCSTPITISNLLNNLPTHLACHINDAM